MDWVRLRSCQHVFHRSCVVQWQEVKNSCPLCRTCIRPIFDCTSMTRHDSQPTKPRKPFRCSVTRESRHLYLTDQLRRAVASLLGPCVTLTIRNRGFTLTAHTTASRAVLKKIGGSVPAFHNQEHSMFIPYMALAGVYMEKSRLNLKLPKELGKRWLSLQLESRQAVSAVP